MQNQLLLLEDVGNLGRKGDLVKAKPGFSRNYLIPQKKAMIATKHVLKLRTRLQEERLKQAVEDKKESDSLAAVIEGKRFTTTVKVDPAGHMYGSVSTSDLIEIFAKEGITMDKSFFLLPQAIKDTGEHKINIRLKEGVTTYVTLEILGEGMKTAALKENKTVKVVEESQEKQAEE